MSRRLTVRREALTDLELRSVVAAAEVPTLPPGYCLTDLDECKWTSGLLTAVETSG